MQPMTSPTDVVHEPGSGSLGSDIKRRLVGVAVGLVLLNLVWFLLRLFDGNDDRRDAIQWPSQGRTWSGFWQLASEGFQGETLFSHTGATLVRVFASIGIAVIFGGGLGFVMGSRPKLRDLLDPFVSVLRLLSPAFVLSMSNMFLGIGDRTIITGAGFATTWFVADGVARAVADGGSAEQMIDRFVQLARTVLLVTWVVVAFSEVIGAGAGLGSAVWSARVFFRTDLMLAVGLWSALLFTAGDYAIRLLGRALRQ